MASETLRAELLHDIQNVNTIHGSISRRLYRKHGMYSERQLRKHFGSFGGALRAAGFGKTTVETNTPQESALTKEAKLTETNEVSGNTWNINLPKTRISTLEELLDHCKVDTSIWSVERFIVNKWEVGAKDDEGNIQVSPLFQVKATLTKSPSIVAAVKEIERLKALAENYVLVPTPIIRSNKRSGNMLEISLNDAHFGKLAWSRETGGPDYDTRIAQREFLEAVEHLLDRASGYEFDSILFVVGNDLIHSDNVQGTTTRGTIVDCDTRYYKTFEVVRETITQCIERFREIAPVIVKMVPGNHDTLSVWHLGDSLSALFKNYDDVVIDNEPTYRKYHQWGQCGLLLTHGDKGKRSDFPLTFATERPDIFGSTKWREVHTGHVHQTRTEEFHGVRVRIIPSLSPADNWHSQNGFIGQLRVGEAYVFNKDEGLIAQFFHNADA